MLVKKKIKNKPRWKSEGVISKEQEDSRHRRHRNSEKTGQAGRWGRAGTRPLWRVQLVQGENEIHEPLGIGPNEAGGFRERPRPGQAS